MTEFERVRESLAAFGAPLAGVRPFRHDGLEATVAAAVPYLADGTLQRAVFRVLCSNVAQLDLSALRRLATRPRERRILGAFVELAARCAGSRRLGDEVRHWRDELSARDVEYLLDSDSRSERLLADRRTPPVFAEWGVRMNATESDLRAFAEKHARS